MNLFHLLDRKISPKQGWGWEKDGMSINRVIVGVFGK